ncbi:MAG: hypothetical protein ACYS3S_03655 [Planctomycetota bacterium]|jgi:hypothetical protein
MRPRALALYCFAGLIIGTIPAGCSIFSSQNAAKNQQLSEEQELSAPYDRITLKKSLTLDALPKISRSQDKQDSLLKDVETVSHSDRVVASLGQSPDGSRTWFNMVTFHEYRLNVIRKYFFAVDDRAGSFGTRPRRGLRFDCEMVLEKGIPGESYTSENLRRIEILRYILTQTREDIKELGDDVDVPEQYNAKLDVCGMLINQTLELILVKLDSSPVLAARLSSTVGADFDHINFGKGRVRMLVEGDTVMLTMRFGAFVHAEAGS